jgi:hypothetical protein
MKNLELKAVRDLYPAVVALGEELTSHYEPDEIAVEQAFDSLPVIAQVNLLLTAANACTTVINSSLKALLRRGRVSAAGDVVIGRQLHSRTIETVRVLALKHEREIAELYERGGQLKDLKPMAFDVPVAI